MVEASVSDRHGGVGTMSAVWSEQASDAARDVIALDGPSGTGKSTVARGLARRLGFRYLDTGAMYRAVTWVVLRNGVDPDDAAAVTDLAARTQITVTTDPDDQHVSVDGRRVDQEIRSRAVTTAVSPVSAIPEVRVLLVAQQRELIGTGAVVVEGRDIGTVVAPDAPLKIFLTASPDARAIPSRRRSTAGGAAEPGSASPSASAAAAIVFAVYMPPHAPSPGQIARSMASTSSRLMRPRAHAPTASNASAMLTSRSPILPGRIDPA